MCPPTKDRNCCAVAKLNMNNEVKQNVKAQALNTKDDKGKLSTV
jgi:hypothetical protein